MDFIVDKPWGMAVLTALLAAGLWATVWLSMWLCGKFDGLRGSGVPVLLVGFVVCALLGPLVLIGAAIFAVVATVMWMSNMAFGWFDYQMLAIKQVFSASASSKSESEGTVPSKTKKKRTKKEK